MTSVSFVEVAGPSCRDKLFRSRAAATPHGEEPVEVVRTPPEAMKVNLGEKQQQFSVLV